MDSKPASNVILNPKNSVNGADRVLPALWTAFEQKRIPSVTQGLGLVLMKSKVLTNWAIKLIGPILQRLLDADLETRSKVQEFGVNLVPTNFYSNIPSLKEIDESFEYRETVPPYLLDSIFKQVVLRGVLEKLSEFAAEFDPPREGDEEHCTQFFWENSQFSYSDAMSYYSFVRHLKPKTILEFGSGFSTLVALEAVHKNGCGKIICIDPLPRTFLASIKDVELRMQRAQELSPQEVDGLLEDGDVVFIDSTHTVKTGSDCLHLYLRVLPKLKKRVFVHVHDVFLPFGLPKDWLKERQLFWTEQYLLLAFLIGNSNANVLYGSAYHSVFNHSSLEDLMHGRYPSGGDSFWFEYNGH